MIYPIIEIPCEIRKVFFFPNFLDILVTIGITKKVVPKAPTHPKSVGQIPAAPASPSKRWYTMIKNENAAMVLKALKTRNVAMHNFRNGFESNASLNAFKISFKLLQKDDLFF